MELNYYWQKRPIPISVFLSLLFSKFTIIFGLFFTMLSIVFLVSFSPIIKMEKISDNAPLVKGRISKAKLTDTYINDSQVTEYHFEYKTPDGTILSGISYSEIMILEESSEVRVQYNPDKPELSRIVGMRRGIIGPWILIPFAPFLIIGLSFLYAGIRKTSRELKLIKTGEIAQGKLLSKEYTSMRVNRNQVFRFRFEFKAMDGRKYKTSFKTHIPSGIEDEELEYLLYNPDEPEKAVLIDSLPKKARNYLMETLVEPKQ